MEEKPRQEQISRVVVNMASLHRSGVLFCPFAGVSLAKNSRLALTCDECHVLTGSVSVTVELFGVTCFAAANSVTRYRRRALKHNVAGTHNALFLQLCGATPSVSRRLNRVARRGGRAIRFSCRRRPRC